MCINIENRLNNCCSSGYSPASSFPLSSSFFLPQQIQELDRRLLASRDSELAYKQHVESLQKNESALQKRVREFELREIDSQARVRELEQTQEMLGDKMAALQRSENRLKYRVQELEGMGGQVKWSSSVLTLKVFETLEPRSGELVSY